MSVRTRKHAEYATLLTHRKTSGGQLKFCFRRNAGFNFNYNILWVLGNLFGV